MGRQADVEGSSAAGPLLRALVEILPSFEKEMLVLRDLVRPGALCVDVGASYGLYAVALARLVGPDGQVIACEPRPRSRAVLRAACRVLAPGNVVVLPVALSDASGDDVLVTPRRRWTGLPVPGRSFLRDGLEASEHGYGAVWGEEFEGASERRTRTDRLDVLATELGLGPIDFVKIDVEGAEWSVLRGMEGILGRDRPVLLCEIEERHTAKYGHDGSAVVDWLVSRGYRPLRYDGDKLVGTAGLVDGEINYFFLPDDRRTS